MAAGGLPGTTAGDTGSSGSADKPSVIRTVTALADPSRGDLVSRKTLTNKKVFQRSRNLNLPDNTRFQNATAISKSGKKRESTQ